MKRFSKNFELSLIILLCLLFLIGCDNKAKKIKLSSSCNNGLVISSLINPYVKDFGFFENFDFWGELLHLRGDLYISNQTAKELNISTENVLLKGNGFSERRAHAYSIAAGEIDFTHGKTISPNETIEVKVYWVVDMKEGEKAKKLSIICNI